MVDEKECEKGKRKEPQERMWESEWDDMKKRKRSKNKSANNPKILLLNYPLAISSTC